MEALRARFDAVSIGLQDARHALETHAGDCTEYMALFVALCRRSGIPARGLGGYVCEKDKVLRAISPLAIGPGGDVARPLRRRRKNEIGGRHGGDFDLQIESVELDSAAINHALGKYTVKGVLNDEPFFTLTFWIHSPGLTMEQKIFDFQVVGNCSFCEIT